MINIRITIEYDGKDFNGWQKQPNKLNIQGEIERAIEIIIGEKVDVIGSGRTDAGVNALAQVANFKVSELKIPVDRLIYAINSQLKKTIRIIKAEIVDDSFHSRYAAKKKTYRYTINNSIAGSAIYRNMQYHYPFKLDEVKMNEGAKLVNIDFTMAIQIINFLVLVYIFWRAFAKKIGKVLEDRKKMALSEMEIVENEKAKLEEQKTAITKLKKESKRRANDILIKAERQADERKDQIVSTAMENRDRMMMKAEADIEKMRLNAKFALQKEVGHMAAELAEKIIKENVKDKQDTIIDNFIEQVGD